MSKVTPIKRPAPIGNLKPIGNPLITADAIAEAINSVDQPSAFGAMSAPRKAILECLVRFHPATPTRKELRLCSGLNDAAFAEHLQSLRWKGWLMFESLSFAPTTEARLIAEGVLEAPERKEFAARIGKVRMKQTEQVIGAERLPSRDVPTAGRRASTPVDRRPATPAKKAKPSPVKQAKTSPAKQEFRGSTTQLREPCAPAAPDTPLAVKSTPEAARPMETDRQDTGASDRNPAGSGVKPACSPSLPGPHETARHEAMVSEERTPKEDRTSPEGDRVSSGSMTTTETPESSVNRARKGAVAKAAVERVAPASQSVAEKSNIEQRREVALKQTVERLGNTPHWGNTQAKIKKAGITDPLARRVIEVHGMQKPHPLDVNPPKFKAVFGSRIA